MNPRRSWPRAPHPIRGANVHSVHRITKQSPAHPTKGEEDLDQSIHPSAPAMGGRQKQRGCFDDDSSIEQPGCKVDRVLHNTRCNEGNRRRFLPPREGPFSVIRSSLGIGDAPNPNTWAGQRNVLMNRRLPISSLP